MALAEFLVPSLDGAAINPSSSVGQNWATIISPHCMALAKPCERPHWMQPATRLAPRIGWHRNAILVPTLVGIGKQSYFQHGLALGKTSLAPTLVGIGHTPKLQHWMVLEIIPSSNIDWHWQAILVPTLAGTEKQS